MIGNSVASEHIQRFLGKRTLTDSKIKRVSAPRGDSRLEIDYELYPRVNKVLGQFFPDVFDWCEDFLVGR